MERSFILAAQSILRHHRVLLWIVKGLAKWAYWLYIIYGIVMWCKPGTITEKMQRRQSLWYCFFSVVFGSVLSWGIGLVWHRQRPFAAHGDIQPFISHRANASFPSNHSMNAMAVAVQLLWQRKKAGVFFLPWAVLIGTSRVLCGVHYVTDVLGGFVLGIGSALIVKTCRQSAAIAQRLNWYAHLSMTVMKAWYQRRL